MPSTADRDPPGARVGGPPGPRLVLRVGADGRRVEALGQPTASGGASLEDREDTGASAEDALGDPGAAVSVAGRGPLRIEVVASDGAMPRLWVAGRPEPLVRRPGTGGWWTERSRLLGRVIGRLPVEARSGDGAVVARVVLVVTPTKVGRAGVVAMLEGLDGVASARAAWLLSQDPHPARVEGAAVGPGSLIEAVEAQLGALGEAAAAIHRRPLARTRETVRAVASGTAPTHAARDARWLAQHPAARLRASGGGVRPVAVKRSRQLDLDIEENRGVVGVLDRLAAQLEEAAAQLEAARVRRRRDAALVGAAPAAVVSPDSSFGGASLEDRSAGGGRGWEGVRSPTSTAVLDDRLTRARQLAAEVDRIRVRTGLPRTLRADPGLRRTHAVASHPAYWRVHAVHQALAELPPLPPTAMAPCDDLDLLYERWCVWQVVEAVSRWAGLEDPVAAAALEATRAGWTIPTGRPLLDLAWPTADRAAQGWRLRLRYEPRYAHRGEGQVVKLQPGRPWRPDVVLEVCRGETVVALHVMDAKHRRDPSRGHDDGLPLEALAELWFRYGDGLGDRDTGLPLVDSVWMLYPGSRPRVVPRVPAMASPDWPVDRLRGGTVSLVPDAGDGAGGVLDTVLGWLLDRAAPG